MNIYDMFISCCLTYKNRAYTEAIAVMPPFTLSSLVSVLSFFLPSCQTRLLNRYLAEAVVLKPFAPVSFVGPKWKHKCGWCHALT